MIVNNKLKIKPEILTNKKSRVLKTQDIQQRTDGVKLPQLLKNQYTNRK